jgi:hypothetical protein
LFAPQVYQIFPCKSVIRRGPEVFVLGRSLGGPGVHAAIEIAEADPEIRVTVFETSWSVIDLDRSAILDVGLESRVSARPVHAWRWALSPERRVA